MRAFKDPRGVKIGAYDYVTPRRKGKEDEKEEEKEEEEEEEEVVEAVTSRYSRGNILIDSAHDVSAQ